MQNLKEQAFEANRRLYELGLVIRTWGNVSAFDRERGLVAIKPSGVAYSELTPALISVVDLDGKHRGGGKPSSDTPTHLALYRGLSGVGGVAHTHSPHATAWAQAGRPLPCFGTTHADHFLGDVPVTEEMSEDAVAGPYEENTGMMILRAVGGRPPLEMPAVLVHGHGPFTWGRDATEAVENASVLEYVAGLALNTVLLDPQARTIGDHLTHRHFFRKHGPGAYYGQ